MILAISIVIGSIIIADSNKTNTDAQDNNLNAYVINDDKEDYVQNNNPTYLNDNQDYYNEVSPIIEDNSDYYDELPPETCRAQGTGCLDNRECCGAMLCCRTLGASSGYCAVSCN